MSELGASVVDIGLVYTVAAVIPEGQLGLAFGLTSTIRGLISLPSPYFRGVLWDRFGPRTPFLVTVGGCLVLSVLAFIKLKPSPVISNEGS
jgi:hypothetical protein